MGQTDTITKQFMSDNSIFADAFNFFVYNGEPVIQPEQLHPLDSAVMETIHSRAGKTVSVQKLRDELKFLTVRADDTAAYAVLGIENQTDIHYAMPVRNLLYDALEYTGQVQRIAAKHKQEQEYGTSSGEYLSGFYKNDKLIPVITLVVYFGAEKWDAPRSLHEMMHITDENLLRQIDNYSIRLIAPQQLEECDFQKFQTSLGPVLQFIKYSREKEKMKELMQRDVYRKLEYTAAMVINNCTNINLQISDDEEEIDMCNAWDEMREDARIEGEQREREKTIRAFQDVLAPEVIAEKLQVSVEYVIHVLNGEGVIAEPDVPYNTET